MSRCEAIRENVIVGKNKMKNFKAVFMFTIRLPLFVLLTASFSNLSFPAETIQKERFPLEFDKENLPVVRLIINKQAYAFIIDTGSGVGLHITEQFRDHIKENLSDAGNIRTVDLAGKATELKSYRINNIRIGNLIFKNLTAAELKPWGLELIEGSNTSREMVLGRDFFKGRSVLFDLAAHYIEIRDGGHVPSSPEGTSWSRVPFKVTDEGMVVDLMAKGKKLKFIVDTATTASLVKKSSVLENPTVSCDSVLKGLEIGNCAATDLFLASDEKKHRISALLIDGDLGGIDADGIIGGNFLFSNRILIDFATNELYISP